MPFYVIKCTKCTYKKELCTSNFNLQEILEKENCPECNSELQRSWEDNKTSFVLNGSGWARDSYK